MTLVHDPTSRSPPGSFLGPLLLIELSLKSHLSVLSAGPCSASLARATRLSVSFGQASQCALGNHPGQHCYQGPPLFWPHGSVRRLMRLFSEQCPQIPACCGLYSRETKTLAAFPRKVNRSTITQQWYGCWLTRKATGTGKTGLK